MLTFCILFMCLAAWSICICTHASTCTVMPARVCRFKEALYFATLSVLKNSAGWGVTAPSVFIKRNRQRLTPQSRNSSNPGPCPQGPSPCSCPVRGVFYPTAPEIRPRGESNSARGGAAGSPWPLGLRAFGIILTIGKAEPKNLKTDRSSSIQREMITTGLISFA